MSDMRRRNPDQPPGVRDSHAPRALSDSGKSSILSPTEMMQPDSIRTKQEGPSRDGATNPAARKGQSEVVEPEASRPVARVTFGDELRRERELRQVELREIAEATKINRRYLEALEQNDFSELPGGLFNRSFVRAYCQTLGIDDEVMVNAYLLEEQVQAARADQFDPGVWRGDPFFMGAARKTGRSVGTDRLSRKIWWWVLAAIVLVVSAALLIYWRFWPLGDILALPVREPLPGSILAIAASVMKREC